MSATMEYGERVVAKIHAFPFILEIGGERKLEMNERKVKTVMLCVLCEAQDCDDHDIEFWYKGYQCSLCLFVHSLNSDAQRCCMDLVSKVVLDDSCFAKEKKAPKAEAEIPVASLQGRRDK